MIPSDHFVRFYNEVFKFLDDKGALDDFYKEISRHQNLHCLKDFWEKGLRGMYDYWEHIRIEENCDSEHHLEDGCYWGVMRHCPSLSKAVNNDAGVCPKYCYHCPGWVIPLFTRTGFYAVFNAISPDVPQCTTHVVETKEAAMDILNRLKAEGARDDMLFTNIDDETAVEAAKARRLKGLPYDPNA